MSKNRTKIIITGASGFLGKHLLNRLKNDNRYNIYALSSQGEKLQKLNQSDNIYYFDKSVIIDDSLCEKIINNGIIINCAFPRNSTGEEIADGLSYIQKLFFYARKYLAKGIINISSQSVYSSKRKSAATEETAICLENTYAIGKYATELMLKSIFDGTKIPYVNVRMASLIGPDFEQRIVNRFIKQAINMEVIPIHKSRQKFGFLDIEDAVNGIIALMETDFSQWKEVYNLGNAEGYTVEEMLYCIKNVFAELKFPFPQIITEEGQDEGSTSVNFQLLYNDTGYIPSINLNESIRKIIEYYHK